VARGLRILTVDSPYINDYLTGDSIAKGESLTGLNLQIHQRRFRCASRMAAKHLKHLNERRRYIPKRPILDSNLFQPDR